MFMPRALISVSDKKGIVEFAQGLVGQGYEIISTGGTFKVLQENGIKAIPIEKVTDFPEMLDGRVKTLHPKIHGGLLAVRDNAEHMKTCTQHGIGLIDLVVVNLYPFEKTIAKKSVDLAEAVENIDIGGPSMLRSAAKNFRSVGVIVNPDKYTEILQELVAHKGQLTEETKKGLAIEVFQHTAGYDAVISNYLAKNLLLNEEKENIFDQKIVLALDKQTDLRYGENPHQKAAFYKMQDSGLADLQQLHGKELSYNNFLDVDAAWQMVKEFKDVPACVVIKHTNPCGAAVGADVLDAYQKALAGDPVSAFGSIVGFNQKVNQETALEIAKNFVEVVLAPEFSEEALTVLTKKPSLRLLTLNDFFRKEKTGFRYVQGGFLAQEIDNCVIQKDKLQFVTKKTPDEQELKDLLFAFQMIKHVKSNAIVIAKDGQLLGVGAGQMSRIDAVKIALDKAGDKVSGTIVASDAFFPFRDSIDTLAKYGVKAIIQPGGSKRDQESIDAANELGVAMVFTGIRHFKH
ncbi:bifunctional phosphoribosylaminoimidazolecarboxamide formyltransferase/IMP cyclohydrolase [bacterium]|nr:bifunctional phosphoribosylaminoimidazolecarboxamide formyltransferase/IMP cyclohydrolase [bacterium]MBT7088335.1 bifunctional phosphoribosylaminoimidazolecarboxamide formyltransferase/IMP cyclohydrolase [bacterium]